MASKRCSYCGEPVDEGDYEYIGNQRVYVCGSRECDRDARDDARAVYYEAAERAREDDYGRYL